MIKIPNLANKGLFLTLALLTLGVIASPAHAFTYTKNNIISDFEMTNSSYLSTRGIEAFLAEKGSVLAGYQTIGTDGKTHSVASVINHLSKTYTLNPMLFLVMAQKESSAITSSNMSYAIENWVLGYGRCDGCSEAKAAPYKGITKQFESAAERIRNGYLADLKSRGQTVSGWGVGITKTTMDGINVTPTNDATAALMTYNPCVGPYGGAGGYTRFGCNSAFQKLWQDWNPSTMRYPNGSLLQIGGVVYLIKDGKKRPFTSISALLANYDSKKIINVPAVAGEQYDTADPINFPNYSLLRNPNGTIFLLVDGEKRGITSQEAFRSLGFNPEEILDVNWKEIDPIPEGAQISATTRYPKGALLQNKGTGAVVYATPKGRKRDIWSKEVMENNFPNKAIVPASPAEINNLKKGKPLKLKDGTLVVSPSAKSVYVIANGRKRPFKSGKVFDKYGYERSNIVNVPDQVLALHSKGKYIKVKKKKKKSTKKKKKSN